MVLIFKWRKMGYSMGMNRISRTFETYRKTGRKALMPYITVGDPDIAGYARDS